MYKLERLDGRRYVGESDKMIVHDTWHEDCEQCLLEDLIIGRGVAVGFDPDDLDQAFWEGFEYCTNCFGRTEPLPPARRKTVGVG